MDTLIRKACDFLGNLKSRGLFLLPNFNGKLPDLRRRGDKFEEYVECAREWCATKKSNLFRDRSEAEHLLVYMGEPVKVAEATLSEGEVGETENSGECEVADKFKYSADESEGELSAETSSITLDESDAESADDV